MTKIVLEKRSSDVKASIEGEPGKWDSGRNADEAIGRLVRTWTARFGIQIQDPPASVERDANDLGIGAVPR